MGEHVCMGMCAVCEADLRARLEKLRGENYHDLLDQMDESWGPAREIGRAEINAFLESRAVHKPTTRLRAQLVQAEARARRLEELLEAYYRGPVSFETYKAIREILATVNPPSLREDT